MRLVGGEMKMEKGVVDMCVKGEGEDVVRDIELENMGGEYVEKVGLGKEGYVVLKEEEMEGEEVEMVRVKVEEKGKRVKGDFV